MSALNRAETEGLQRAQSTLQAVLREGFDPDDEKNILKKAQIRVAIDDIRTIVTMKGYYSP